MTYRTSEEPARRVATIGIGRSRSWWVGLTFGSLFAIVGLAMAFSSGGPRVLGAMAAIFGFLVLWGTNLKYPARRVVLDERSGTARFEARTYLHWLEDETISIGEVAAIEQKIASYEPERDDALVALKDFLR